MQSSCRGPKFEGVATSLADHGTYGMLMFWDLRLMISTSRIATAETGTWRNRNCHHALAVRGCSLGASTDDERHAHDVLPMAASSSFEMPKL